MSEMTVTLDGLLEFGWCWDCGKPFRESVEEVHLEEHRLAGTEAEHAETAP